MAILLICILPEFNLLMFGSDYILANSGFLIYLHTIIFLNLVNLFSSHFVSIKKPSIVLLTNLMMYFVFVIAGHFLIKSNGLFGFLYAELLANLFMLIIISLFAINEAENKNSFLLIILKMIFIYSLFTFFINFVANIDALIQRMLAALFLTGVLSSLILVTLFSPSERKKIRSLIPI
tara:strand:+ start:97 stop:630 length:534 start_codon:yes stop_codon:yes gene_type:complete